MGTILAAFAAWITLGGNVRASLAAPTLASIVGGILAALLYDNFIRKADAPD